MVKPSENIKPADMPAVLERIKEDARLGGGRYVEGGNWWQMQLTPEVADIFFRGHFVTPEGRKVRIRSLWISWIADNLASVTPAFETFE